MKEVKSYVSDDGVFSGSYEEVMRYEDELAKRNELKKTKKERRTKINDKIDELSAMIDGYYRDYKEFPFDNLNLFPVKLADLFK